MVLKLLENGYLTLNLRLLHKSVGNTKADKYQYREKHKSWDRTIKALNPKMKFTTQQSGEAPKWTIAEVSFICHSVSRPDMKLRSSGMRMEE